MVWGHLPQQVPGELGTKWTCHRGFMAHHGAGPSAAPQDPLTFGALAAVGVGAVHALGTVLAGGAGTLIDVKLAQVPVEAWNGGRSHVPAQGRTRQGPLRAGVSMGTAAGGPECGAATHH